MAKFPAYGGRLWQRRLLGDRVRVVTLLVGNRWRTPEGFDRVPRIAVKTERWDQPRATVYDWRLVTQCTVLAVDVRGPDERELELERAGNDPWFYLLARVRRYAREVLMFTPTLEFTDPAGQFAAERELGVWAFVQRTVHRDASGAIVYDYPPWWPYGDTNPNEGIAA